MSERNPTHSIGKAKVAGQFSESAISWTEIDQLDHAQLIHHLEKLNGSFVHFPPGSLASLPVEELRQILQAAVRVIQKRGY